MQNVRLFQSGSSSSSSRVLTQKKKKKNASDGGVRLCFTMIPAVLIASAWRRFASPTVQVCFMFFLVAFGGSHVRLTSSEMQKGLQLIRFGNVFILFYFSCSDESSGVLEISIKEFRELGGREIRGWVRQVCDRRGGLKHECSNTADSLVVFSFSLKLCKL